MPDYFFELKLDDQLEKIIKSKDLYLLQALVGKRCPAFLQYCASFYICKINVLEARKQVEKVKLKAVEYYLDEIKNGRTPETLKPTAHVLSDAIRAGRIDLKNNQLLSDVSHSSKFLLSPEYKNAQTYVQETNIGNLCMMSPEMIDGIYENLIKDSLSHIDISGKLKDIQSRLKKTSEERTSDAEYVEQLREYKNALTEMKDATFLQDWYKNLLDKLINTAINDKNHLLHKDIYQYSAGGVLDTVQEKLIKSKIYTIKNKVILKKVFFKILGYNASFRHDEIEKTCNDVFQCESVELCIENIMTKDFVENLKKVFEEDKMLCNNELIKFFLKNISLSCFIDAEQIFLDELLLLALKHKQNDAALLLIFNGANCQDINKLNPLPLEKPLVLEIKRLYKDMPSIRLPFFTLKDLIEFLPDDELLHKISKHVVEQNENLKTRKELADKLLKDWENSNFFVHWIIKQIYNFKMYRIKNAEIGMQSLENSVTEAAGIGTAELFYEELLDIINADGYFSLNKSTYKNLIKLGDEIENASLLTVKAFATNLNLSKQDFIKGIREEEKLIQAKEHSKQKVCQLTIETMEVAKQKEKEQTKKSTIEEDREQLRREREEASNKKIFLEAKSEALDLLYDKADERQLQVKYINPDIKNKLVDYFACYILNTQSLKEFKDIYGEYEKLENDFKAQIIDLRSLNESMSKLNAHFVSVKSRFLERQNYEIILLETLILSPDEVVNDLLKSAAEQMKTSREIALQKQINIEFLKLKFPKDIF